MINTDQKVDIVEASQIQSYPSVTIGIPTLNEEEHIEQVISNFLGASYPNILEIIIADGGSSDKTKEIVNRISTTNAKVKLIDNPEKFQSFALNKAINRAQGEIFLRADAHCEYGADYVLKCVSKLLEGDVKNVGGAARFLAKNLVQAGTALSVLSLLGNGGAKHYNPDYNGYSDTVPMGCFWTKDLLKLKGFTESNHTNEDAEINYRIRKVLNGKIYISSEIKLWYYSRSSISGLFKQYLRYGRGRFLTGRMHKGKIPFRSKAPFIFLSLMVLFLIADLSISELDLGAFYLLTLALSIFLFESIRIVIKERKYFRNEIWRGEQERRPNVLELITTTFLVLVTMHVSHFSGYLYQMIRMKFFRKTGW